MAQSAATEQPHWPLLVLHLCPLSPWPAQSASVEQAGATHWPLLHTCPMAQSAATEQPHWPLLLHTCPVGQTPAAEQAGTHWPLLLHTCPAGQTPAAEQAETHWPLVVSHVEPFSPWPAQSASERQGDV
jgi:hypothetical protein